MTFVVSLFTEWLLLNHKSEETYCQLAAGLLLSLQQSTTLDAAVGLAALLYHPRLVGAEPGGWTSQGRSWQETASWWVRGAQEWEEIWNQQLLPRVHPASPNEG